MSNRTVLNAFLLDGFSDCQHCQMPIFSILLLIYIFTFLENMTTILLVIQNSKLWKPMYIFIGNLSFLEIGYINVILPKMFSNILIGSQEISYGGCVSQLFIFAFLSAAECYLLASMAFDRYVAICNPLRYHDIMQDKCVWCLLISSWLAGLFTPIFPIHFLNQTDFCGSNKVDHYFCDVSPLMRLACGDTKIVEFLSFIMAAFVLVTSLSVIITSYIFIIWTVLKIPTSGYQKAFSTCTSHLVVVCVFYGSLSFTYMRITPSSGDSSNRVVSVLYCIITPMVNPVIYTLRNYDIRLTLKVCLASWSKPKSQKTQAKS